MIHPSQHRFLEKVLIFSSITAIGFALLLILKPEIQDNDISAMLGYGMIALSIGLILFSVGLLSIPLSEGSTYKQKLATQKTQNPNSFTRQFARKVYTSYSHFIKIFT